MIPIYDDQPTRSFPLVTILIIAVNFIVFAWWQLGVGLEQSVALAGFVPAELARGSASEATYLFTSMFMHGSWLHLIGNMWFLWLFGNNIEDITSHFRFVLFYALCGIIAAGAHIVANPSSTIPIIGASGAVSGVLGAYLMKHPHARVRTVIPIFVFIRVVDIPAFIFLLLWIGLQVLSQMTSRVPEEGGGVAYLAHIAGFVAGMVLINLFQKRRYLEAPTSWARYKRDERSY